MTLVELVEAARCRNCKGNRSTQEHQFNDDEEYHGVREHVCRVCPVLVSCPRCVDHPGIDPDVILNAKVQRHDWREWGHGVRETPTGVLEPCDGCGKPRAIHPTFSVHTINYAIETPIVVVPLVTE